MRTDASINERISFSEGIMLRVCHVSYCFDKQIQEEGKLMKFADAD